MCLPINHLNNIIYLIKDTSTPLSNQLLPKKQKEKYTNAPTCQLCFLASRVILIDYCAIKHEK
jgi:hypothetical protein